MLHVDANSAVKFGCERWTGHPSRMSCVSSVFFKQLSTSIGWGLALIKAVRTAHSRFMLASACVDMASCRHPQSTSPGMQDVLTLRHGSGRSFVSLIRVDHVSFLQHGPVGWILRMKNKIKELTASFEKAVGKCWVFQFVCSAWIH